MELPFHHRLRWRVTAVVAGVYCIRRSVAAHAQS